jgi:hypothetical protein
MISSASGMAMQLRLDLTGFPAPAAALWELVGAEQRQRAVTLLAALIAQAVGGEATGDELASLGGAGALGGRDD